MEKDKLYCGRHYNDLFKARCKACDESIMEANFVKAEGASWHTKHFCCHTCDLNLAGKRYVCRILAHFQVCFGGWRSRFLSMAHLYAVVTCLASRSSCMALAILWPGQLNAPDPDEDFTALRLVLRQEGRVRFPAVCRTPCPEHLLTPALLTRGSSAMSWLCSAKKAVAVAAPEDAKEAPDEEIYMTVKLRGQDNSSRIKTMASIKIKAAAPPSDAAPASRRKSLLADNAAAPADAAPKRGDSIKVCVCHAAC